MKFFARLNYLFRHSPEELFEFYLSVITALWGIFLFFPTHSTFNIQGHIILNVYAPQQYFALGAALLGVAYLSSVFFEHIKSKRFLNLAIAGGWTYITILYLANNPTSTNVVFCGALAIFSSVTYLRQ